jgi:hypothetical protein
MANRQVDIDYEMVVILVSRKGRWRDVTKKIKEESSMDI